MTDTSTYQTPSGAEVTINNSDQSVGGLKDANGNVIPTPAGQSINNSQTNSNPLIVTSGASRTQYNSNVSSMNNTLTSINGGGGAQPGADPTKAGSYGYDTFGNKVSTTGVDQMKTSGGTYTGQDGNMYYKYDNTPVPDNAPADTGSGTDTGGGTGTDGGSSTTDSNGVDTSKLDPGTKKMYTDAITTADQTVQQRQADLTAAKATVANDPAASAALDAIGHKYDVLIQAMKDKNAISIGRAQTGVAAFGGLGVMNTNFMSDEMDAANSRITNLVNQEQDLLLKTTIAYKNGDVKALNAAQNAYDKANTDKLKAINDLNTATNKAVTQAQAQQRIDTAAKNSAVTNDVKLSTNIAKTIADTIKSSGITDQKQIDSYIQGMADKSGITDVNILKSAVAKSQADQSKADLSAQNINSEIDNRGKNKAGSTTFKVAPAIASVTTQMEKEVKESKSTDGFIDPQKWLKARTTWNELGGTDATFKSNFIKYLNPASYPLAGYKTPKTTTTGTGTSKYTTAVNGKG